MPTNFGDALSPLIVAAWTGRPVCWTPRSSDSHRLVAIGTIGHHQREGTAHIWGAGFAGATGQFMPARGWQKPAGTRIEAHATRGPFTAAMLRAEGIKAPALYGDPAVLLPPIWPGEGVEKRHELGVFLHVSELTDRTLDARPLPEFRRYDVPTSLSDTVGVHHQLVPRTLAGLYAKLEALLACKRVLSSGLHALVLAEAYGIPCAVFDIHAGSHGMMAPEDETQPLDHRMRDFYAGIGASRVPVFRTARSVETDWDAAIRFIDTHWAPQRIETAPLLESFPRRFGRLRASPLREGLWPMLDL